MLLLARSCMLALACSRARVPAPPRPSRPSLSLRMVARSLRAGARNYFIFLRGEEVDVQEEEQEGGEEVF